MSVQFENVWAADEVEQLLADAGRIIERLELADDLRAPAYGLAVQLLTQRIARPAGGVVVAGGMLTPG